MSPRQLEGLYRVTRNPLYVIAAIASHEACPDAESWPLWVVDYLKGVAEALMLLAVDEKPSVAAKRTNAVLGLTGNGRNRFADYRQDIRALNAAHIHGVRHELFVRDGKPEKAEKTNDWLGKALGVKPRRAQELAARGRKLKAAMTG